MYHYHPQKKSHSSHHVTQRFYRTEGFLPEVAQLLCSVEGVHPKFWRGVLGSATCSVMEMIIFESAYGSYCTSGFLKPLKIFPHHSCELEKIFSLPAVEYHSVPYSIHHLVLFLKDICFRGGKYFIILVHLSVEKHFF